MCAAQPALAAKAVKVIAPLAAGVAGANHVVAVDVTIGETAKPILAKLDAKAVEKRTEAKLPGVDPTVPPAERPAATLYPTLPLTQMLPLLIEDVTKEWNLVSGRALKLAIVVDTLKTADAGMAMLLGSSDELAGTVSVLDADSGAKLGEFYVDVLNYRAGMLGLAMRGSGVREKLAAEFAKHVSIQLTGSKKKPKVKA